MQFLNYLVLTSTKWMVIALKRDAYLVSMPSRRSQPLWMAPGTQCYHGELSRPSAVSTSSTTSGDAMAGSLTFRWSCCLIGGASGTIHGTAVALVILAHLKHGQQLVTNFHQYIHRAATLGPLGGDPAIATATATA